MNKQEAIEWFEKHPEVEIYLGHDDWYDDGHFMQKRSAQQVLDSLWNRGLRITKTCTIPLEVLSAIKPYCVLIKYGETLNLICGDRKLNISNNPCANLFNMEFEGDYINQSVDEKASVFYVNVFTNDKFECNIAEGLEVPDDCILKFYKDSELAKDLFL